MGSQKMKDMGDFGTDKQREVAKRLTPNDLLSVIEDLSNHM